MGNMEFLSLSIMNSSDMQGRKTWAAGLDRAPLAVYLDFLHLNAFLEDKMDLCLCRPGDKVLR